MPSFEYQGRHNGQRVSGVVDGETADAVASLLAAKGIIPLTIDPKKSGHSVSGWLASYFKRRITLQELVMFSRQMYTLMRSGVPIVRAIRGLADNTRNPYLAEVEADLAHTIESGKGLAVGMQKHPKVFSRLYVSLMYVGESTGQLDKAFEQVAMYLELEHSTRQQVKSALRYPMFVLVAILMAVAVINLFVIPVFADIFATYNQALPLPTRILVGCSEFTLAYWPHLALVGTAIAFLTSSYLKTPQGRLAWHQKLLQVPLIGRIINQAVLARFSRSLAVMLRAGVPIIQALQVTASAVGNDYVAKKIIEIREATEHGDNLTRSATQSGLFTPLVLQMIAVGEETGALDDLLVEVAEFYEREVDYDLKSLSAAIEPIMIIVIAALVLMLALGVFLPLWDMSSAISSR